MEGAVEVAESPQTVEDVFKDYKGRREGILKALTTDVDDFFHKSDPDKENLCLYGLPDGSWEVNLPAEEIPPEIPEPALGINFARDGMERTDWLALVAVHSDAWLVAVAFYYGARFNREQRKELFNMINEVQTLFGIVTGKSVKDKTSNNSNSGSKGRGGGGGGGGGVGGVGVGVGGGGGGGGSTGRQKSSRTAAGGAAKEESDDEEEEEYEGEDEEEDHGETVCGSCGKNYADNEFWIGCDVCQKWFHGKCVKMSQARAEHIKQYKCPSCKRGRPS